jgi:hypothetical protein
VDNSIQNSNVSTKEVLTVFETRVLKTMCKMNPLEVSKSRMKRDGISGANVCRSWLRHVLEAERAAGQFE